MIVSKSTGKIFTGKLAALMLRIGVASESDQLKEKITDEKKVVKKPTIQKVKKERKVKVKK